MREPDKPMNCLLGDLECKHEFVLKNFSVDDRSVPTTVDYEWKDAAGTSICITLTCYGPAYGMEGRPLGYGVWVAGTISCNTKYNIVYTMEPARFMYGYWQNDEHGELKEYILLEHAQVLSLVREKKYAEWNESPRSKML